MLRKREGEREYREWRMQEIELPFVNETLNPLYVQYFWVCDGPMAASRFAQIRIRPTTFSRAHNFDPNLNPIEASEILSLIQLLTQIHNSNVVIVTSKINSTPTYILILKLNLYYFNNTIVIKFAN